MHLQFTFTFVLPCSFTCRHFLLHLHLHLHHSHLHLHLHVRLYLHLHLHVPNGDGITCVFKSHAPTSRVAQRVVNTPLALCRLREHPSCLCLTKGSPLWAFVRVPRKLILKINYCMIVSFPVCFRFFGFRCFFAWSILHATSSFLNVSGSHTNIKLGKMF